MALLVVDPVPPGCKLEGLEGLGEEESDVFPLPMDCHLLFIGTVRRLYLN